jgi:hypothetical protein
MKAQHLESLIGVLSKPSWMHCGSERKLTQEKAMPLQPPADGSPWSEVDGAVPRLHGPGDVLVLGPGLARNPLGWTASGIRTPWEPAGAAPRLPIPRTLAQGCDEEGCKFPMEWVRRHDQS